MARTWSLTDTLLLGQQPIPPFTAYAIKASTRVIENSDYSAVFFSTGDSIEGATAWKYDGSLLLDIGGDFFYSQTGTYGDTADIAGLCWFKDNLYAAYDVGFDPFIENGKIARWNGTTGTNSWTDIYNVIDEDSDDMIFSRLGYGGPAADDHWRKCLDTDESRMAIVAYKGGENRILVSNNGIDWTLQNWGGGFSDPAPFLVGREQGSNYRSLLCLEGYPPPGIGQALVIESGPDNTWTTKTDSSTGTNSTLIGYGDGRTFFMVDQGTGEFWELESSADWGVTFDNANGPTIRPNGWNFGWPPDITFKRFNNVDILFAEQETLQAYAWDSDATEVVTDGTTGHNIWDFFRLNGILYALCGTIGSGEAQIYSAGAVADDVAEFYQGEGALDFKVNLTFPGVAPGGMAVKDKLDTVVLGSDQGYKEMVDYARYPYEAILDMDNGMATGAAISAMEWL